MTVHETVTAEIARVANEHHKTLGALHDSLPLFESGLDSLCLAVIVARLEEELGVDPFASASDGAFPVTVGDFVALYENATV